jgi:hypothetical protein
LIYTITLRNNQNNLENNKMNKLFLSTIVAGIALGSSLIPSAAEALKVQVQPNITFWQSSARTYAPPRQVVREYHHGYYYNNPYPNYYYYYPVQEVVEYYPVNPPPVYSTGTDFALKFRFR